MEDQPKNLGTLCRVCGKSFDEDDRVTKISNLKIRQKVKTELFGEDEKNTHPDKICRRCKRKIDAIDKNFRNSIKHPTLPYNFTEDKKSLAKFEESSPVCHHVWSCTVCGKHSKETHTQQTHNDDNHEDNIEVTFRDENPRLGPTKSKFSMRYVRKCGNVITHEKLECGNEAIKTKHFVDHNTAKQLSCTICKWFPETPVLLKE